MKDYLGRLRNPDFKFSGIIKPLIGKFIFVTLRDRKLRVTDCREAWGSTGIGAAPVQKFPPEPP
jgi:hypothetical protein